MPWRRQYREPRDLEEYVAWSQEQQAKMLGLEMKAAKDRFPRCGGILMSSAHDTFPLTINSSLIDFDGKLKPVAAEVSQVWRGAYRRRGSHEQISP